MLGVFPYPWQILLLCSNDSGSFVKKDSIKYYMCCRCVEAIKQIKEKTHLLRKKEICVHFTFLYSSQESDYVKKRKR